MDLANLWFFTMFLIRKSSNTITSYFLTNLQDSLCKKSLRWFLTLRCILATLVRCSLREFEPFVLRDNLRCSRFNLTSDLRKYLGFSTIVLSDNVANFSRPTSIPTALPVLGSISVLTLQAKQIYHLSTSFLTALNQFP